MSTTNKKRCDIGSATLYHSFTELKQKALQELVADFQKQHHYRSYPKGKICNYAFENVQKILAWDSHPFEKRIVIDYFERYFNLSAPIIEYWDYCKHIQESPPFSYWRNCYWRYQEWVETQDEQLIRNNWERFHWYYPKYTLTSQDVWHYIKNLSSQELYGYKPFFKAEKVHLSSSDKQRETPSPKCVVVSETIQKVVSVVSQEIVPFQSKELVKTTLSTTPESQLEKTVVSKQEVEKEQSKIEQPIVEEIVESLPFQRKDKEFFLESLKEQKENISHYTPEQQRFLHLNNLFWRELDEDDPNYHPVLEYDFSFSSWTYFEFQLEVRKIIHKFEYRNPQHYQYIKLTDFFKGKGSLRLLTYSYISDYLLETWRKKCRWEITVDYWNDEKAEQYIQSIPELKQRLIKGSHLFRYKNKNFCDYNSILDKHFKENSEIMEELGEWEERKMLSQLERIPLVFQEKGFAGEMILILFWPLLIKFLTLKRLK